MIFFKEIQQMRLIVKAIVHNRVLNVEDVYKRQELMGYTSWACIDLISESTKQISKRYGYIYVDLDDQGNGTYNRIRKDSFYWYQKVIQNNSLDFEEQ